MSEENKSFDELIDESFKTIHTGEIVEGTVLDVKPDQIVVNVGCKSDGVITREEYSNDSSLDLTTVVSKGDSIEAKVLKTNDGDGLVQLSYKKIGEEKANKRVEEAFENKEKIKVTVEKITSGGLITEFEGAKIFVPASLVSDSYEKDLSKYLGQEFEIIVTEYNPRKRRVIGNRKTILREEKAERAKEVLAALQIGDEIDGIVKSVTAFGAFVDLGGVDGLLHISEMSWGRVDTPKSLFKSGDEVRVFIKDMADGKIALSCKFPDKNPWFLAKEKYTQGTIVTGKVARLADFGAFIELEPGIDALLHVSQISRKHVKKPSDVLSVGQIIDVKIVDFKEEERRISLSRRDFADDLVPDEKPETPEPAEEEVPEAAPEPAEVETPEAVSEPTVEEAPEAAPEPAVEEAPDAAPESADEEAPEAAPEPAVEEAPDAAPEPADEEAPEAAPEPAEEEVSGVAPEPVEEAAPGVPAEE